MVDPVDYFGLSRESCDHTLDRMFRAAEMFRQGREGATLLHMQMFLAVASRPPTIQRELVRLLGLPITTVNGAMARLIDERRGKRSPTPFGLLSLDRDSENGQRKIVALTSGGLEVVARMRAALRS